MNRYISSMKKTNESRLKEQGAIGDAGQLPWVDQCPLKERRLADA